MYKLNEKIIKLAQNPENVGILEGKNVYSTRIVNPVCGDVTDIYAKIEDGKIVEAKFQTFGCFVTIASASALTMAIKGKNIEDLFRDEENIIEKIIHLVISQLGEIPEAKRHCPPASVEAFLRIAKAYYEGKDESKVKKIENLLEFIPLAYKKNVQI